MDNHHNRPPSNPKDPGNHHSHPPSNPKDPGNHHSHLPNNLRDMDNRAISSPIPNPATNSPTPPATDSHHNHPAEAAEEQTASCSS